MSQSPADFPLAAVPLFPLPNVVLFPRAILPLHIFEERYRTMTVDAVAGEGLVAMALLKAGWEQSYHGRAEIEPIVCVGQILSYEELPDGNFNFLLQGKARARILREHAGTGLAYRVAELSPVPETAVLEIDLVDQRRKLSESFANPRVMALPVVRQFQQLLGGPMPTSDIADLAAFNFLDDLKFKQDLLAEGDVRRRVEQVAERLSWWSAHFNPGVYGFPEDPSAN
jgi:uncharacterized protein